MASGEDHVATERDSYIPLMEHVCCYLQKSASPCMVFCQGNPACWPCEAWEMVPTSPSGEMLNSVRGSQSLALF